MTWTWNPWAVPDLLVFVVGVAMAVLVWVAGPDRVQNRLLATFLFLEGFTTLWFGVGAKSATTPSAAYAAISIGNHTWTWLLAFYLLFASTLETPIVRPLRNRWVRGAIVVTAAATSVLLWLRPAIWRPPTLFDAWYGGYSPPASPMTQVLFASALLISIFVLIAAASVFARTPRGSPRRVKAKAFVLAFAFRDVGMIVFAVSAFAAGPAFGLGGFGISDVTILIVWPFALLAFQTLLALGIIRTQLLDIDLKLKWTLRRGTIVAMFVAVFFVVSETVALVLGDRLGPFVGILAAGALLFALAPLQGIAERISDKAMPGVTDTAEYRMIRKRDVYRSTFEELLADGTLTGKERRTLIRLQEQLGLDATAAQRIEAEVLDQGNGQTRAFEASPSGGAGVP